MTESLVELLSKPHRGGSLRGILCGSLRGVCLRDNHRFIVHIRRHWSKHLTRIRAGKQSLQRATEQMRLDYGLGGEVWEIHAEKLQVPPRPPSMLLVPLCWSLFPVLDFLDLCLGPWRSSGDVRLLAIS